MNNLTLQQILQSPYDLARWQDVLREVFGATRVLQNPDDRLTIRLTDKDRELASRAAELGSFETSDEMLVGFYQVDLTNKPRIWQNRVGLRSLLRSVYKYDVDAALVVFVQGEKWRLSLVSDIRVLNDNGEWVRQETAAKRFTYLLGPGETVRTPVDRLENYHISDRSLSALIDAFSVEPLNKAFFREYKIVFDNILSEVQGNFKEVDEARLFTQRLLNRLMFLYFIQKKGWMKYDGQENYLRALFDESRRQNEKSFFHDRLYWVFFHGLGKYRSRDNEHDEAFLEERRGHVSYLNGGLFEQEMDGTDAQGAIEIGNQRFEEIFQLFENYNFTIDESTPFEIQVAVDPEMLGKVFEELVTGRHSSGSYYTPRTVVSFMCREALKHALAGWDSEEAITGLVDENDSSKVHDPEAILTRLRELTICDPACGSGAYLLGMLQELVHIREALFAAEKVDPEAQYRWKREIIENSVYGVDIDRFATQIAALRLWLSLAIESDSPHPLPNLKYKIGCGDTLLAPIEAVGRTPNMYRKQKVDVLKDLKAKSTHPDDPSDETAKREIDKQIAEIRAEIAAMLDHEEPEGVFDWSVEFAEVFEDGGFDVVLANPPYVRQEEIKPKNYKDKLLKIYSGSMTGKSDLYVPFYQRGMELLRDGGTHVFVCSNSWLDVGYGAKLQKYLLDHGHIAAVYDSAVERQFSTAAINTIISFIHKQTPADDDVTSFVSLRAPFNEAIADAKNRRIVTRTRQELIESGSDENRRYEGDKWGGKYLRAPDIFIEIQNKCRSNLTRLSTVALISGYIHDNNTGEQFPAARFLKTIKHVKALELRSDSAGVIDYGVKPDGNSRLVAPILFPRTFGSRHIIVWNPDGVFGKEFYKVIPNQRSWNISLAGQLNSTFGVLQRELIGLVNLGDGAIKFSADDVGMFLVVPQLDGPEFRAAFTTLVRREQLDFPEELNQPDRRKLDGIIFDAIGLSPNERDLVYKATAELVRRRTERAQRVTAQ